jgi:hypothetical protein
VNTLETALILAGEPIAVVDQNHLPGMIQKPDVAS